MLVSELDYELPPDLIAQRPLARREASRLLVPGADGAARDRSVADLPQLLPRSLIVWNDTRVIPARLRGQRPTGGKVELLLLEPSEGSAPEGAELWRAMGRANRPLRPGAELLFGDALGGEVRERLEGGHLIVELKPRRASTVLETLDEVGEMPLPPYIARETDADDDERYQTVFARHPGAVAAPTAGLHFSEALRDALRAAGHEFAYVTLHVGPGTFRPVTSERVEDHPMHRERYSVPEVTARAIDAARAEGRPVMAVGTTVVRTLEAAARDDKSGGVRAGEGDTALFIRPGFTFRVVDSLLTNFHLPKSTLLALVMAFMGEDEAREAYRHAVEARYRFFSYGDAMWIERRRAEA